MSEVHGLHATIASLAGTPPDRAVYIQSHLTIHAGPWARKRIRRQARRILAAEAALRPGLLLSWLPTGKGLEVTVTGTAREVQIWLHRIEGQLP